MKAIEVQLAVHRAPETSRIQQDQLHRPLIDQVQLAGQANAETERARHRSAPTTEAADARIRKDGEGHSRHEGGQAGKREQGQTDTPPQPAAAPHPFKGKHFDLSL